MYPLLLSILLLISSALFADPMPSDLSVIPSERVVLRVGEQRMIHIGESLRIRLSRRGVIHMLDSQKGLWRITGLKSGVVVIEIDQRGGHRKILYVNVEPKLPTTSSTNNHLNSDKSIANTTPEPIPQLYQVKARIELRENKNAENHGASDQTANMDFNLIGGTVGATAISKLESNERTFDRKIIAEPSFMIRELEESIIKSGGEAIHSATDEDGKNQAIWHEYGMALTLKLQKVTTTTTAASILLALKSPSMQGQNYSMNQIQTSAVLNHAISTLVGTVDLATDDKNIDQNSLLSHIPIIAPLFKNRTTSVANAKVHLWLELILVEPMTNAAP